MWISHIQIIKKNLKIYLTTLKKGILLSRPCLKFERSYSSIDLCKVTTDYQRKARIKICDGYF